MGKKLNCLDKTVELYIRLCRPSPLFQTAETVQEGRSDFLELLAEARIGKELTQVYQEIGNIFQRQAVAKTLEVDDLHRIRSDVDIAWPQVTVMSHYRESRWVHVTLKLLQSSQCFVCEPNGHPPLPTPSNVVTSESQHGLQYGFCIRALDGLSLHQGQPAAGPPHC